MTVTVRLSSGLAELVGTPRLGATLPEGATVADLLDTLRRRHPSLAPRLQNAVAVVGGRHVPLSEPLASGAEVALLLPIAGG